MIKHLKGPSKEEIAAYYETARIHARKIVMADIEKEGPWHLSKDNMIKLTEYRITKMFHVSIQQFEKAAVWREKEREIYDNYDYLVRKIPK